MFRTALVIFKTNFVYITVFTHFSVFQPFFGSCSSSREKLLENLKNVLNKVATRYNSLPNSYPICDNEKMFIDEKKKYKSL